ncbi:JAB domain-containing protein [Ruficoccus sp. ZRK36]|uniref:JAB domain-containing protein n=1 Tax=Ruficoccus sp. ZRK36 TaxID=2866311 RepID=UPI001C729D77|nr:JAB domain-containing protein [Ruficoccus sp. ZRK36]QYY35502.1 hypothetical protein K0V07_14535 [Ruficoccus sp. ZRK36]
MEKFTHLKEVQILYKSVTVEGDWHGQWVEGSESVVSLFRNIQDESQKKLMVMNLHEQFRIVCFEVAAIGGNFDVNDLKVRDLFTSACIFRADYLMVVQNYMDESSWPKDTNIAFTDKVTKISKDLGIQLLDNIIIGKERFYSFAKEGLLPADPAS